MSKAPDGKRFDCLFHFQEESVAFRGTEEGTTTSAWLRVPRCCCFLSTNPAMVHHPLG